MSSMYNNEDFRRMKKTVIDAYSSETWKWKVSHMKPQQIIAIYFNLKKQKAKKVVKKDHQISLYDIYPEVMKEGSVK